MAPPNFGILQIMRGWYPHYVVFETIAIQGTVPHSGSVIIDGAGGAAQERGNFSAV